MIAVVADTHLPRGRRRLPEACIRAIRDSAVLLHAGDVASAAALEELKAIGPPVKAVRGNVDSPELVRSLPEILELTIGGVGLGMVHDAGAATGRMGRMKELFPTAAAVIYGHTHRPDHRTEDGFQIFNPGSPTERRRAPHRSMGLAEVRGGKVSFRHFTLP